MRLTQDRLREVLEHDLGTGVFRWRKSLSNKIKLGAVAGTKDKHGYVVIMIDGKNYFAHRLAWMYIHGYFPENDLDHKDRNPSNNRMDNLREVSHQCNLRNTGNRRNNTSGVKGISWNKRRNKWESKIQISGKTKHLGRYENFDEAVMARYRAEKEVGWAGCDSSSPAYQHLKDNNLLNQKEDTT